MADLTLDEIRIDRDWSPTPGVIFIDAAAEATRYNCCFTFDRQRDEWYVMIENLQECLPALPHLQGWHWTYFQGKLAGHNQRTAMALTLLCQMVFDVYLD